MKDQQEAERKKVTSQEIQVALIEQTKVINEKQTDVMEDLSKVEPAVIEAQQGKKTSKFLLISIVNMVKYSTKSFLISIVLK